jgi:hypothetical protein
VRHPHGVLASAPAIAQGSGPRLAVSGEAAMGVAMEAYVMMMIGLVMFAGFLYGILALLDMIDDL